MATVRELLALIDAFDWASYHEDLKGEFAAIFGNIVDLQGQRGADRAGGSWNNDDAFVQRSLTTYVGDRIVELDKTTKTDVGDLIRGLLESDEGAGTTIELGDAIAEKVQEKFAGYEDWRADRIARTETSVAYNFGNIFGYRQAGVEEVEVSDGDGDEECAAANGQTWTLEEALANPVAHPNCERDFSPNVSKE
jgi:hypothetical protein